MNPIADWKNASEYPKWNAVSLKRIAWEFLRRNPAYQSDWAEYLAICRRLVPSFDLHVGSDWDAEFDEHDDYFRCDPPRLEGENDFAWIARVGRGTRLPLHSWYARKWGLKHNLPDPFHPYEKYELGYLAIQFERNISTVEIAAKGWDYFNHNKYPFNREPKQALVIDYSIPIEQQLNAAKPYLLAHQRILIREGVVGEFPNKIPRKELVIHLRMLDAEAAGIDAAGIAKEIYPGDKNFAPEYGATHKVNAALKIAEKWRDEWYRLLPSMKK